MEGNQQLLRDFYEAFARKDHATMATCYRNDATFGDPVFVALDAEETRAMWRMFCLGGQDLSVTFSDVKADEKTGSARWEARYTFAPTGRSVHNVINASFEFADGRIAKHRDSFGFYKWTRMALGPVGLLAGWTPMVRNKVRKQAAQQLQRFVEGESG